MRKKILFIITIAMLMMSTFPLGGCKKNDSSKVSLAMVGGGHSNMPVFSDDCKAIYGSMYEAAYTHGDVTYLTSDGSPQVVFQTSIPEAQVSGLSEKKKRRIAEDYVEQLQIAYSEVSPSVPEVNTLKAITMAARALSDSSGDKNLLIVDSGLSTTGYLNCTNGILNADPKAIVDALISMQALPNLTGTKVTWVGLGDTIEPQEELSERQKENLKRMWEEVLIAAGAESVVFDGGYSTNMKYEGAPYVSTVPVENETVFINTSTTKDLKPLDTLILDSTTLQFIGDQSNFVDEKKAEAVLKEAATKLISNPNNKVYIIGTTAGNGGDGNYSTNLAKARAERVKSKLIQMGVAEDQMTTKALPGAQDPFHLWDLDRNGNMIEEIAEANRKTIIMDINSPEARLIR